MQNASGEKKNKSKGEENCFGLCQHHSKAAFPFPAAVILLLSCVLSLPLTPLLHFALDKHSEKKVQPAAFSTVHHLAASHSHISLLHGAVHGPPNENEASLCCARAKSLLPQAFSPPGFQGKTLCGTGEFVVLWMFKGQRKPKGNTLHCWVVFNTQLTVLGVFSRAGSDLLRIFFQGLRKGRKSLLFLRSNFP